MKKTVFFLLFLFLIVGGILVSGSETTMHFLTKGFADTLYCQLTGCAMEGDLDMGGYNLLNVTIINATRQNLTIIDNLNVTNLRVDHIAEKTTAHGVVFDNKINVPAENTPTNPTISIGDGDTGWYQQYNDEINFAIGGVAFGKYTINNFVTQGVDGYYFRRGNIGVSTPTFTRGYDTDSGLSFTGTLDEVSLSAGGIEGLRVVEIDSTIDITIFGDLNVTGEISLKDTDGEYHNLSRDLQTLDEISRNITLTGLNGTLDLGTGNVTVTTLSGDNIVVNIDKTETILNKNSDSIIITSGTNESPILNQIIYINSLNPVLAKRTTLGLKSPSVAAFLQGANYTYVSAIGLATTDNLIGGLFNRFFRDGSTYRSGFEINVSTNMVNISTGVISFLFSEIEIIQNHSTSNLYVHNHDDGSFHQHFTLDEMQTYMDGSSVGNNKYYNVVFGIAITHDGAGVMYVVTQDIPSTEYTKAIDAEIDLENTINFFPPDDIVSLAYIPIVRVVVRRSGGVNTIQTLSNNGLFDDLRGTITKTSSSPPPSGITVHSDLTNLAWSVAGHTIDTNIDWNGYNLTNVSRLGIGIGTPTSELHVIGNANVTGTSYIGNVTISKNTISTTGGSGMTINFELDNTAASFTLRGGSEVFIRGGQSATGGLSGSMDVGVTTGVTTALGDWEFAEVIVTEDLEVNDIEGVGGGGEVTFNADAVFENDLEVDSDGDSFTIGEGTDISLRFDSPHFIIDSRDVTANDEVFFTDFDKVTIEADLNVTGNTILGSPTNIRNITMFTNPSGNPACCGVLDDMSFVCSAGVCD